MHTKSESGVVLAAEVVGYRRLLALGDPDLASELPAVRAGIVEPAVATGRVLSATAEGIVVSFERAADAVAAAVSMQRGLGRRNERTAEDRRIEVRIGIDGSGDGGGDDAPGGAAAAKGLMKFAPRGGILLSDRVHAALADKTQFECDDRGPQKLPGLPAPVRAWRVRDIAAAPAPANGVAANLSPGASSASGAGARRKIQPGMIAVLVVVALGIALGVVVGQSTPPQPEPAAPGAEGP